MKIALVHDWLITEGGAEKVLQELLKVFPGPVHTLFYDQKKLQNPFFLDKTIQTSFLQRYSFFVKNHRWLLPLFPCAIEKLDLSYADVILSSSHAVAKGITKRKDQLHICYCHTPMRYAWDLKESYIQSCPLLMRGFANILLEKIRKWDQKGESGVDSFIANSFHVAKRIRTHYKREAKVIYPPVCLDQFFRSSQKENYYVTHARLVPYKRIDLWVEAFSYMPDKKLIIIGEGPEKEKLKRKATKNVEFLGFLEPEQLALTLSKAKAYLFAAEEDFGIAIVEAQAAGLPVLALKKGGALEIITDEKSGLFFKEATLACCIEVIHSFEKKENSFDPDFIQKSVKKFGVERFKKEIVEFVEEQKKVFYENCDLSRR
ncbi:MAG: glycosyltransferase [Verrucomicrobia bacterium]|nr:glycosyltransferase [Verrucomicrobiota bacterium]